MDTKQDVKKYSGCILSLRTCTLMIVLMVVVATCAIISQSEKTDAMFRNVLSGVRSVISGISSGTAIRGARSSMAGGRSMLGIHSNSQSANTASGSVVYDYTLGGSPVFTTHPGGRRMYYGETDAVVLAKELGVNVDPNVKYNMYYDADGPPIVRTTTSGKLLSVLAHSEIRIGTYEDYETGNGSQKIVIAGPWWVRGSDIIGVSSTTSKPSSGISKTQNTEVSVGIGTGNAQGKSLAGGTSSTSSGSGGIVTPMTSSSGVGVVTSTTYSGSSGDVTPTTSGSTSVGSMSTSIGEIGLLDEVRGFFGGRQEKYRLNSSIGTQTDDDSEHLIKIPMTTRLVFTRETNFDAGRGNIYHNTETQTRETGVKSLGTSGGTHDSGIGNVGYVTLTRTHTSTQTDHYDEYEVWNRGYTIVISTDVDVQDGVVVQTKEVQTQETGVRSSGSRSSS